MYFGLNFEKWKAYFDELPKTAWVPIYKQEKDAEKSVAIYSALVPTEYVDTTLESATWDCHIGDGQPSHVQYGGDEVSFKYLRFGNDTGIEPLVRVRTFHGVKSSFLEISEEFRHYFNLYPIKGGDILVEIDDAGDEVEVVRGINSKNVTVNLKHLRKFLALKGMKLALYCEVDMSSTQTLEQLGIEKYSKDDKGENHVYSWWVSPWEGMTKEGINSFGRFIGKIYLSGYPKYRPELFDSEERKFENFIISVDEEGNSITHTSDDSQLSNYFGKNPGAPHYLSPVFFKREVLKRYYDDQRFEVEDGYLRCAGLWGMRLDNDHEKYVIAYLGDLGHIPNSHQSHWKTYNIPPDGAMSETALRRGLLGEFADPISSDLVFKRELEATSKEWHENMGWNLHKPLEKEDRHLLTGLHIPKDEMQKEFEEQVKALATILIDNLNKKELEKLPGVVEKEHTIQMLQEWMKEKGLDHEKHATFLRGLQNLRTGTAHIKGSRYEKGMQSFAVREKGFQTAFNDILKKAIEFLGDLRGAIQDSK